MSTGDSDAAMRQERQRVAGSPGKQAGAAQLKVAIVCDWLLGTGGAERVVLELHKMFPDAPIYTSQYDPDPKVWHGQNWFSKADVRITWLQKLPRSLKKFLPVLRAWTFSRLDLSDYDLVISSSGAEAKGVKTRSNAVHISYIHAPTHYYWSRYDEYLKHPGFGLLDPLARLGLRLLVGPMRRWDRRAAQRPDYFITNSTYTQKQIKKYYGRESAVIHPPVDINRFQVTGDKSISSFESKLSHSAKRGKHELPQAVHGLQAQNRKGFVTAGRQTPYKRIDLAVAACTQLNLPLTVIGNGPDHQKLVKMAGPTIKFLTNVNDSDMPRYFQQAEGFIFPGIDDFGIVAVEALAAGTPVIAFNGGGALDYVDSKTGLLFESQTVGGLVKALKEFNSKKFINQEISDLTQKFSPQNFDQNASRLIKEIMV